MKPHCFWKGLLFLLLAFPPMASANTITLVFQVQPTSFYSSLSGNTTVPSVPPFNLTVTFDDGVTYLGGSNNGTYADWVTSFGMPSFSATPFTASLLALNPGIPLGNFGYSQTVQQLYPPYNLPMNNINTHLVSAGQSGASASTNQAFRYEIIVNLTQYGAIPDITAATGLPASSFLGTVGQTYQFYEYALFSSGGGVVGEEVYRGTATLLSATQASPVPEPGTLALFGTGLLSVAGMLRRKIF